MLEKNCIIRISLLCTYHLSQNVSRMVQSRRVNWAELVGSMEKKENVYRYVRKP
jgi:hypothetical protein